MDCQLEIVAGRWTCPDCDWVYPRPLPCRPPRRNCPTPTTPTQIRDRVRYDLGTGIDDDDWPEVSRRATACCGCPKFSGYGCAELGKRCRTGRIRWLERLVMGECDGWAT